MLESVAGGFRPSCDFDPLGVPEEEAVNARSRDLFAGNQLVPLTACDAFPPRLQRDAGVLFEHLEYVAAVHPEEACSRLSIAVGTSQRLSEHLDPQGHLRLFYAQTADTQMRGPGNRVVHVMLDSMLVRIRGKQSFADHRLYLTTSFVVSNIHAFGNALHRK